MVSDEDEGAVVVTTEVTVVPTVAVESAVLVAVVPGAPLEVTTTVVVAGAMVVVALAELCADEVDCW